MQNTLPVPNMRSAANSRVCLLCPELPFLTAIRHPQAESYAVSFHCAPLPGGRRSAAARAGVSDCAGFAPN